MCGYVHCIPNPKYYTMAYSCEIEEKVALNNKQIGLWKKDNGDYEPRKRLANTKC